MITTIAILFTSVLHLAGTIIIAYALIAILHELLNSGVE